MPQESLITDEMRAAIGVEGAPTAHVVEQGAIKKFAEAIGDPNPLYYDEEYAKKTKYGGIIAPPTYLCVVETVTPKPPKIPLSRRLNGGNEFELFKPVRPGDVITASSKIVEFQETEGRLGRMLIMISESTFQNQTGEIVGRRRNTGIMY